MAINSELAVMTIEDFMQRYSDDGPFEIIDGEVIPVAPQVPKSANTGFNLARKLADFVDEQQLGTIMVEAPFVLELTANWVKGSRVPDIMFYKKDRLQQLATDDTKWDEKPLTIVPDLAIEVVSPTDRYSDVNRKVAHYLEDGVQRVWVVDAQAKTIVIYNRGVNQQTTLTIDDTLSDEDILVGLSLPIKTVFGE